LENESSVDGMSKTACASIRFNTEGKVDEISGLKNGDRQTVEDSLIPIVEQEVLKYPLNPEKHFKENSGQNEWSTSNKPKWTTVLKVS